MDGNRHKETAQKVPTGKKQNWKECYNLFKQKDLYRIRQALVEEIMTAVNVVLFSSFPLEITNFQGLCSSTRGSYVLHPPSCPPNSFERPHCTVATRAGMLKAMR